VRQDRSDINSCECLGPLELMGPLLKVACEWAQLHLVVPLVQNRKAHCATVVNNG
jgi:hypothetical protein